MQQLPIPHLQTASRLGGGAALGATTYDFSLCRLGPLLLSAFVRRGHRVSGLTGSRFPGLAMAQKQYFIHGELTGFLPASLLLSLSMRSVSWARVLFLVQRQPQVPAPGQEEPVGNGQEGRSEEGKGTGSTWTPPPATPT